jgi:AAHS family 4-hydroxybenzoate transporter-like MFS transporter
MSINVTDVLDNAKLNSFHILIVALCALMIFFDGFDLQAIGFAAPALAEALHISRPALGAVFSAGQFGLILGGLAFGLMADRWGRKPVFILSGVVFGIGSIGTALSGSYEALVAWRVFTGIGLGAATPIAVTVATDYLPRRHRVALTIVMYTAVSIGGVFGGAVSAYIATFGWQTVFYVGGMLPLIFVPILFVLLPESLNFLVSRGRSGAQIAHILERVAPGKRFDPNGQYSMEEAYEKRFPVAALFRNGYAPRSILVWLLFFMSLTTLFFMTNWMPSLFNSLGVTPERIVGISAFAQAGALLGAIVAARLTLSYRAFLIAGTGYLLAAIGLLVLGNVGGLFAALLVTDFLLSFFFYGVQNVAVAMTGRLYPPRIRGTGVGWGLGVGRVGGVVGPTIAGALLALHFAPGQLFMFAAIPCVLAGVACLVISVTVREAVAGEIEYPALAEGKPVRVEP